MKHVFYAFLMAGFAAALLGFSLQGLTRDVETLRHRADETDRSLRDARADVDQLRGETTCTLESRVSRTDSRTSATTWTPGTSARSTGRSSPPPSR